MGGERIVNCDDPKKVLVISAGSSLEDWEAWVKDDEREVLEHEIERRI